MGSRDQIAVPSNRGALVPMDASRPARPSPRATGRVSLDLPKQHVGLQPIDDVGKSFTERCSQPVDVPCGDSHRASVAIGRLGCDTLRRCQMTQFQRLTGTPFTGSMVF